MCFIEQVGYVLFKLELTEELITLHLRAAGV